MFTTPHPPTLGVKMSAPNSTCSSPGQGRRGLRSRKGEEEEEEDQKEEEEVVTTSDEEGGSSRGAGRKPARGSANGSRNSTSPTPPPRRRTRKRGGSNNSSRASSRDSVSQQPGRSNGGGGGAGGKRSERIRASLDDPDSKESSSKPNSATEEASSDSDDDNEEEEEEAAMEVGRTRCKLCGAVVRNGTKLRRHAAYKHFREEICKDLSRTKPFSCPASACDYEGETFRALFRHYAGSKHSSVVADSFMSKVVESPETKESLANGTGAISGGAIGISSSSPPAGKEGRRKRRRRRLRSRARSSEGDGSESGDADSEQSDSKVEEEEEEEERSVKDEESQRKERKRRGRRPLGNAKMAEFRNNVYENLKTLDGRRARVIDEKNIECVCGKAVRLSTKYYWKYFVQKPTVKNGTVVQKGHWFNCPLVKEAGSHIPPHEVSQKELEDSKVVYEEQQKRSRENAASNSEESEEGEEKEGRRLPKRRRRKVLLDRDVGEPEEKKVRELLSATAFSMERRISEQLSTRVPGETFLQDGPCFQMSTADVVMCHMCRSTSYAERKEIFSQGHFDEENSDVSCCFYAFRKLVVDEAGSVRVAGYLDPLKDPKEKDLMLWRPDAAAAPAVSREMVRYTLGLIGDQFCDMVQQERQHLALHGAGRTPPVWKPPVKGVREMCDVCQTTLFNAHWTCGCCGIVVCLDCFQFRRTGMVRERKRQHDRDTDEYDWPMCNSGRPHGTDQLLVAQIIPGAVLVELSQKMHSTRQRLGIQQFCHRKEDLVTLFTEEGVSKHTHMHLFSLDWQK